MIIVVNPSGSAGHSFKGLQAYCAHDAGSSDSSERVAWSSTRNIEAPPEQAWKVMAATASMADELKAEAGVRAGRKTKHGPVMHLVMSYTDGEPTDRKSVERDVDQMLSKLGADPAKMRGKSKPSRKQFANEHQVQMWAHEDTDAFHVHVSINTVHPEHGIRLPTSNNYRKLQRWALAYSKEKGTDHLTPAREENVETRKQGEYVKHPNRKNRKAFEEARALEAVTGSKERAALILKEQKKKDKAVFDAGRALKIRHREDLKQIEQRYLDSIKKAAKLRKAELNRAKSDVREKYRPVWRELSDKQAHELETFMALEKSFFGRTKNILSVMRSKGADEKSHLARAFRIISNRNERRAYLEKAQLRERQAVQLQVNSELIEAKERGAKQESKRLAANRKAFREDVANLRSKHFEEKKKHGSSWKQRNLDRYNVLKSVVRNRDGLNLQASFDEASKTNADRDEIDGLIEEFGLNVESSSEHHNQSAFENVSKPLILKR